MSGAIFLRWFRLYVLSFMFRFMFANMFFEKNPNIKILVMSMTKLYQKSKLHGVAVANGFWVPELRVRKVKIGSKSCFANFLHGEISK